MEENKIIEIIPSILTSDLKELEALIHKAEREVKRIHIDIIDGVFADNKTIDPLALENIDTSLVLDFHLMVNEPVNWIEKCLRAGADRAIGQIEMMSSVEEFIIKAQSVGISPGIAIDLNTPVERLDQLYLKDLDVVLVMSVAAGFGGQKFDDKALEKIKKLNTLRTLEPDSFRILDDGGVQVEHMADLSKLKVDDVVIGQRIFEGDLRKNIEKYKKAS